MAVDDARQQRPAGGVDHARGRAHQSLGIGAAADKGDALPATATASACGWAGSSVSARALVMIRSADCAALQVPICYRDTKDQD